MHFSSWSEGEWIELSPAFFDINQIKGWDKEIAVDLMSSPYKEIRWHQVSEGSGLIRAESAMMYGASEYYLYKASNKKAGRDACKKSAWNYHSSRNKKEEPYSVVPFMVFFVLFSVGVSFYEPPQYMPY